MTRAWTAPTTPTETVLGAVSCAGITETALVCKVMSRHALTFEWAEVAVKNAIVDLVKAERIEQIAPGVSAYRLAAKGLKMEPKKKEPPTIGGYRNYVPEDRAESATTRNRVAKSTDTADKTPILGHPCLSPDGE